MFKKLSGFKRDDDYEKSSDVLKEVVAAQKEPSTQQNVIIDADADEKPESEQPNIFNLKDSLMNDKLVLDLLTATEQIIRGRQLAEHTQKEMQARNSQAQQKIDFLNKEINRLNSVLHQREAFIEELEANVEGKNVSIDQLVEDYNDLQSTMTSEIRELKNTLELEKRKYQNFKAQSQNEIMAKEMAIREKEEQIIALQTENKNLQEQYGVIRQENNYLLRMVNDFTNRMSSPLTQFKGENVKEGSDEE